MHYTKNLVIGAGITGLAVARLLQDRKDEYLVLEKSDKPGGLIRCDVVEGHLYHRVGGHVFNTRIASVSEWFWNQFRKDEEFIQAERRAGILLNGSMTGYPLENYLYRLDEPTAASVIDELLALSAKGRRDPFSYPNFEDFLKGNFGETLYRIYFGPYNRKIWQAPLSTIPLPWLEGKLPMPDYREIILSNLLRKEESGMVHSRFFYPRFNGSQFIADRISKGLNIITNTEVESIVRGENTWIVNGTYSAERIIYTGDIRMLHLLVRDAGSGFSARLDDMKDLRSNGTSNLLCETDDVPWSWVYLPGKEIRAHRVIFTGNFSPENDPAGARRSCTVEFSGIMEPLEMKNALDKLPFHLKYISHTIEPNSYVIQQKGDRERIAGLKARLEGEGFYLAGRFAEWEYYNMDKAIESAMMLTAKL